MMVTVENISENQAIDFIKGYNGTFSFLLSLKAFYFRKHFLSAAQLSGVKKCMVKQAEYDAQKLSGEHTKINDASYSIKANTVVKVGRFFAKELGKQVGLDEKGHFAYKVVNVLGESSKAYQLELRASGARTSFCSCCGRTLTDSFSVLHGIGPICASRHGVANAEQLDTRLASTQSIKVWLPKSALKLRIEGGQEVLNSEADQDEPETQGGENV